MFNWYSDLLWIVFLKRIKEGLQGSIIGAPLASKGGWAGRCTCATLQDRQQLVSRGVLWWGPRHLASSYQKMSNIKSLVRVVCFQQRPVSDRASLQSCVLFLYFCTWRVLSCFSTYFNAGILNICLLFSVCPIQLNISFDLKCVTWTGHLVGDSFKSQPSVVESFHTSPDVLT